MDPRQYVHISKFRVLAALMSVTLLVPGGLTIQDRPIASSNAPQACVPAPEGLIAWWTGDGNAGDDAGSLNGRLINGTTFALGKVGPAFRLDGSNDYVAFPYSDSYNFAPDSQFTLETWFQWYPDSSDYWAVIVKSPNSGAWDWGIYIDPTRKIDGNWGLYSQTIVQQGVWYHVAVAYNNHDYKMYVNGVLESELSNVSITQSSGPINIGRRNSSHNYDWDPFKGLVDEGGLYNRQLSADEILSIYSAGPDGKCKPVSYVSSITPSYTPSGDQYQVSAAVTVYDAHGIPVTHATVAVDVTLPDGSVMQGTLTTKGNGSGTYSLLSSQTGTYTFTVTNVTALTRSYDPSLNVESSDSITVP